jgi:outer membrane protein TolC
VGFYDLVATIEATHPLMHAARAGLESLEAKLQQARWAYFPTFELTAGAGATPEVTGDALHSETNTGTWGYLFTAKATMVQPLYTFGKLRSLRRAGKQGVHIGNASVDLARWELRYRLAQAWFGSLMAKAMSEILEDGKDWLVKSEARMERLRDEDSDDYDQNEHLRLKSRSADFYALEAQNRLLEIQSTHGLRLLSGETDSSKSVPLAQHNLEILNVAMETPEHFVALAMQKDPLLRIKRATARAKSHLHDHQKSQKLPDLLLVGEANAATSNVIESQDSAFASNDAHQLGVRGLVVLRWNLNVPQLIFQGKEAGALATMSAMETETSAQLTELNVRRLWQELENARMLVGVYEESKKAAQGWLTANWDLYEDDFADFNDVMDALVQFYGKKIAYLKTIHDHNVLVYALSQAVGQDITGWSGELAAKRAGFPRP